MGAPVIFGTVTVKLHDLPPAIAMNTLRIAGKRVLAEAKAANAQLKATKAALGRPEAMGLLALITPPFRLDRHSIVARSEEHTSELQSLMRISYAVFCLK